MFRDRQNQVYPILWRGTAAAEKRFASLADWRHERCLYDTLDGTLPLLKLLDAAPGRLTLLYRGAPSMLEELRRQARQEFDPAPWRALAQWLKTYHAACGELPARGDLRNFLWDSAKGQVIGLDLECCKSAGFADCGRRLTADLLGNTGIDAAVKRQAAATLAKELGLSPGPAVHVPSNPADRRRRPISGVILAGGASRRMGTNKAELRLGGVTLLQLQVEKMRALGITDIMLSGEACPQLPGVRVIADQLPGNGPLGGLYTCLRAAKHEACLVLSVDTPLIPAIALAYLCQAHRGGATILRHGPFEEPLIAVYDSWLAEKIPARLQERRRSVREFVPPDLRSGFAYRGPEALLKNCNTPEEFSEVSRLADAYAAAGISLTAFGLA